MVPSVVGELLSMCCGVQSQGVRGLLGLHGGLRTVVGCLWGAWVGEWRGSGVTKGFAAVRVKLCGLQKALGGVRLFHGRLFAGSEFQCDSCSACNSHIAVTERNEEVGS